MNRTTITMLLAIVFLTLAVLFLAPFVGMEKISPVMLFRSNISEIAHSIFWKIRVPRVLIAFITGSALALSGMAFQAMFRNALATPFTLGVSSGAAVGAAIYVKMGFLVPLLGFAGQSISAFLGAILSISLVYGLTQIKKGFSSSTLLLAGVAVNFFFSSLILFLQYLSDFTHSFQIVRWLMGGFEIVGYKPLISILPLTIIGLIFISFNLNELNLLMLGEDLALSRGVAVKKVKTALFIATSLMVGSVVSVCGPIGFVGMMVPHICRLIIGTDHRHLAAATFLIGGTFLVLCDTIARTLIAPAEIPVGVITSMLGGPFFIWLLVRKKSENFL